MTTALATLITDLRERGGLKNIDVANIATASLATVSFWTSGASCPRAETQLLMSDLRHVVDRLAEVFQPAEVRDWLYADHPLLGGERPVDLIQARRAGQVLAVIDSLDAVAYA